MTVYVLDEHPACLLAGKELARCLGAITRTSVDVSTAGQFDERDAIYVGTGDRLAQILPLPAVKDPHWDDGWTIKSVGPGLVIAGVNPRSTLMAAYHYLRSLGAEWLWPGDDGEHLPRIDSIPLSGIHLSETAAHRHRGVCIEGASALEHVLDMVEWLPRVGLNAYFLQFHVSSFFWRQWYRHDLNPTWPDRKDLTEAECSALDDKVIAALKQRDLILHRVGHGWTAAALNLPTDGWLEHPGPLPDDRRNLVAEVNGKRDLWHNIPINTELCYSNPEARRRMADALLQYAADHPEVDVLHFWLSDAVNNHCECDACRRLSPSDWYATLLNEISPRLRQTAPHMKLAFLAYLDTLWPATRVRLDLTSDNLIYMFAPISRCYGHNLSHPDCGADTQLQHPKLNSVAVPHDNQDNQKLLHLWDSARPADSFAYEYHLMTAWIEDHLSLDLSDLIPRDIADYRSHGVDGIVNCSTQRAFYPNGWPYYLMARSLWSGALPSDAKSRYFTQAYGDRAPAALAFFHRLSSLTDAPIHKLSWWDTADAAAADNVLAFLADRRSEFGDALHAVETPAQRRAWRLLIHYSSSSGPRSARSSPGEWTPPTLNSTAPRTSSGKQSTRLPPPSTPS